MDSATAVQLLDIQPLKANVGLRRLACAAIKQAITNMDIYGQPENIRLDERQLSRDLGVSRTPVREALSLLEQEGFVRSVPRAGVFVVRKTRSELIEMITVWSAIESMAAWLACKTASSEDIAELRKLTTSAEAPGEDVKSGMAFHRAIIAMGQSSLMAELTENLFIHIRAIRATAMRQHGWAQRRISEHMAIVEALEERNPGLAAQRVRDHILGLVAYLEKYGDFLDRHEGKAVVRKAGLRESRIKEV